MQNFFRATLLGICLLSAFQELYAQKFTISGYIKDKNTGEVLIGANIYNKENYQGTTSNNYGFYSLTLPADSMKLMFSYVGYQSVEVTLNLDKDTEINIGLEDVVALDEIVISGREEIQEVTQMSKINVPIAQIKAMPALLGEVDVLKVLQLLPGIQSGTEGSSGLYVRGGGPDQNLILLDGVPIYNASHLFGFFSVFNADAINNVDLIKGGFPARYGGRLSSVIDITMKEGNHEKLRGEGAIGLISSKLTLEGPINERTTFLFSGRRTYIDLLARPLIKAATEGDEVAGYYFYDLNAKINHKFSNRDRVYLSGYFGNDDAYSRYKENYDTGVEKVFYEDEFGLDWGNIIAAMRWNHVFNPKFFSNLTLTYSRYRFDIFENYKEERTTPNGVDNEDESISYFSGIRDFAAKMDFEFIPNPNHYIRFGINGINHTFNPGILSYKSTLESDTTLGSFKTSANEFAAYLEDDIKVTDHLKVNAGIHISAFDVEDELYTSFQPRLAVRYLLSNGLSIKGSYAQMTQFIHLLTNGGIGLPTDLWLPSTRKVAPQESHQFAFGLAKTIKKQYEISVEAYYKEMDGLIEYKEGASFLNIDEDWQEKVETGRGESYGAELFVQKKTGKFTGWVGYTLSWSNRQFDNLNFGRSFPYKYDRRHDISITGVYKVNDRIDISGAWVYGTGNSITLPISKYNGFRYEGNFWFRGGNPITYHGERNGYRMRSYHRLDFSISFSKQKKWGTRKWTIGTYNTYSTRNPFFIDIGYHKNGGKKFIQYSLFPIIPSISYSFKF
ncbi:TonB-dependent receptor [Fulvivirgaceae bacterium BMA12]|uniref:TonB-dependent receptor n=1 Tax=Agaribacillus aureus TaxID=3051825 RepID=A0ABT8L9A5_9BACT|nr:TonB-dependent receptor [Fulvivirgaceae bacterium BMA12]